MSRATLVATISSLSRANEAKESLDWKLSDWLEIRADLMPEQDPIALRRPLMDYCCTLCEAAEQGEGMLPPSAIDAGVCGKPDGFAIWSIWKLTETLCRACCVRFPRVDV